jgi:hypothetical protein
MGQVCTRDDEVDKQAGNAPTTLGQTKDQEPTKMKQAAVVAEPPKEAPPKQDSLTQMARSQIEDVHVDAKNLEPCPKMNIVNATVQRRVDSLKPVRPEDFPELKAKYSMAQNSGQIVMDRKTKSTYQGQMYRGVPHGWGRYVLADGGYLEGFFEEGNPSGYIRRFASPNGSGYEGYFSNNQFNGKGTLYDDKGNVTECMTWVNGQPQGFQTIRNLASQQEIFSGSIVNGKKNGKCRFYDDKQKATVEGEFKDDFLEGRGVKSFDNGQKYEGDFRKGIEEGKGTLSMIDGRKFEGPFSNGKPNGKGFLITDTGKRIEQTWKDGKRV